MSKKRFLNILKYLKISLLIPFAFLLLIHFVIKDRTYDFARIFNIAPVPILIGCGLLISLILMHHKKWFRGTFFVTILLICHWFYSYYGFKNTSISQAHQHVLLWNIDDSKFLPRDVIRDKINRYNPEVITLMETRKLAMTDVIYLKEQFPQYNFQTMQGYFLVGIKGDILSHEYTKFDSITKHHLIKAKIKGDIRTLLMVDVGVIRWKNRWQDLKPILDYSLKNKVDMMIGDFNTPYESMHFDNFREAYQSFHNVSEGFAATWPKGLPLLELDQIWVKSEITPISLKKFFYKDYSNHDMLIGSFEFTVK